jgi:hypothetical protein
MGDWKMVLMEQRAKPLMCWFEPFVKLMAPKMFNLRHDPFESATFAQFPPVKSRPRSTWTRRNGRLRRRRAALTARALASQIICLPRNPRRLQAGIPFFSRRNRAD